ncbi:hypothetical protein, partial [Mycobacterium sp.]|uniref:hypothetical protein n=1 Tax=Mycobacterium sp. TaxID=1785 RepID=UPI003C728B85
KAKLWCSPAEASEASLLISPMQSHALMAKGIALCERQELQQAFELFDQACARDPFYCAALGRAQVSEKLGLDEEPREAWNRLNEMFE